MKNLWIIGLLVSCFVISCGSDDKKVETFPGKIGKKVPSTIDEEAP